MANYFQYLKSISFFKLLSDKNIQTINNVCHEKYYDADQIVFSEGAKADKFYMILEGSVEVWKEYDKSGQYLLSVNYKGFTFGEMALIDNFYRSATVVAKKSTKLLFINQSDFNQIIQKNSSIAISILKAVSSILRKSTGNYVETIWAKKQLLKTAKDELKKTQEELLRAERLSVLGKFSSRILHDIRNPLSIIRGYAEIIIQDVKEKNIENLNKIVAETDRLNDLASELLDYSKGEISLNICKIDIEILLLKIVDNLTSSFKSRNIKIVTQNSISDHIKMDDKRMFRVFSNLAANAYKAMPDGGIFTITALENNKFVMFDISDTGIGMTKEVKGKIFEQFFSNFTEQGTGLGMSIIKSIIKAHNGSITVTSKVNVGTQFKIIIPKIL